MILIPPSYQGPRFWKASPKSPDFNVCFQSLAQCRRSLIAAESSRNRVAVEPNSSIQLQGHSWYPNFIGIVVIGVDMVLDNSAPSVSLFIARQAYGQHIS